MTIVSTLSLVRGAVLVVLLLACRAADAAPLSCAQAAAVAETTAALPPGLLLAIGNVESGRSDGMGKRAPWPWTINASGAGRFFESREDAVLAVQGLRANGVVSVDIGCFQINLMHHPNAFPDLASGFDPLTNGMAAARFLVSLHEEFGAWEPAVAAYHSRIDTEGAPYRDRVLAVWHGGPLPAVTLVAGIHVWGPQGEIASFSGSWMPGFQSAAAASRSRLPRIITASVR